MSRRAQTPVRIAREASTERMLADGARACDAYTIVQRRARQLEEDLQEITANEAIPEPLAEDDSLVLVLAEVIESHQK